MVRSERSGSNLLEELRAGDAHALQDLHARFFLKLVNAAERQTRAYPTHTGNATDIAASVFESVWRRARIGHLSAAKDLQELWLTLLLIANEKHRIHNPEEGHSQSATRPQVKTGDELESSESKLFSIEALDDAAFLLLDKLPAGSTREVMFLTMEGYTVAEIAETLELAPATVLRKARLIQTIIPQIHTQEAAARTTHGFSESVSTDNLTLLHQGDAICDSFEDSWKLGHSPSLDAYLTEARQCNDTLFADLVAVDIHYRWNSGESPSLDDYTARYPGLAKVIRTLPVPNRARGAVPARKNQSSPRVGRFELIALIGEGSFGLVWKAWDTILRRHVAIKRLRSGQTLLDRDVLQREGRVASRIDHPNVVRVLETGHGDSSDYIVFEFVTGPNLKQWLDSRSGMPVAPDEAARMILQVALGVQAIHDNDIVHRDIKPANILIAENSQLKVTDFGLARHLEAVSTISGGEALLGTIPYMSPEQCDGEQVGKQSDIFSVGVLLYELLTCKRPFEGTASEIIARIKGQAFAPFDESLAIPQQLERICRRALEKRAEDRYQTAQEFADDLNHFLRREEIRVAASSQAATFSAIPTLRSAAGPALLSAVALLVGVSLYQGGDELRQGIKMAFCAGAAALATYLFGGRGDRNSASQLSRPLDDSSVRRAALSDRPVILVGEVISIDAANDKVSCWLAMPQGYRVRSSLPRSGFNAEPAPGGTFAYTMHKDGRYSIDMEQSAVLEEADDVIADCIALEAEHAGNVASSEGAENRHS